MKDVTRILSLFFVAPDLGIAGLANGTLDCLVGPTACTFKFEFRADVATTVRQVSDGAVTIFRNNEDTIPCIRSLQARFALLA
jgi:hypothetical protein